MAKPITHITPPNRVERWKKLWATPRLLTQDDADAAFEEFEGAFVPGHMQKLFLRTFGLPKASFGNRFFKDDSTFQNWDARLSTLLGEGSHVDVTVISGSPERLEAYALRGERRRTLRDIVIDDWHAACVIVRSDTGTLYVFIEPKMRGCIVLSLAVGDE